MASDRSSGRRRRLSSLLLACAAIAGTAACAHDDPRRFRLRAPVTRDQDLEPFNIECKAEKGDVKKCAPEIYESSFAWDAADNSVFRPASDALLLKRAGDARNVNAFDEVPDSSWFTNRIGQKPLTPDEVEAGFCKPGVMLDPEAEDGSWVIDHGKDNGANPGFRVKFKDTKFMMKTDESQGERATAATAMATRFYYAAGWWAPCDAVVYFRRELLKLKPGLTIKANVGPPKKFDEALLEKILEKVPRRGNLLRATASRWLPGAPMGPFMYEGRRDDDPGDVIPHEHRRDLRGARVIAAWLNHFDSREQNSMITWEPTDKSQPWRGVTRHWYIDLGDCFGSEWAVDAMSKRLGYSYLLDFRYILQDFASLGAISRPWDDNVKRTPGFEDYGYFGARWFDPDEWKGEYPNPAFQNMQEGDAAWAARIIARFGPEHVMAALKAGDLTKPEDTRFLFEILMQRQHIILARYFAKVSPLSDARLEGDNLCATDLARATNTYPGGSFRYLSQVLRGTTDTDKAEHPAVMTQGQAGRVCIPVPSRQPDGGASDDDKSRYVTVQVSNGASKGPLVAHLYDLGPKRGLQLVALERPE
ncbi:MAG: hypothetical protein JWP97_3211 [Labilithrix sp.]|nr:hypothetical protein [Labilithrix sp.]